MNKKSVVMSVSERMPWTIAARALRAANIPMSQGWTKTAEKLESSDDEASFSRLLEILEDHTRYGEKFTKFYILDEEQKSKLRDSLSKWEISKTKFSENYPCSTNVDEFKSVEAPFVLVWKQEDDDGLSLVFTCEFSVVKREIIDDREAVTRIREAIGDYDEIVGLKSKKIQLFNVINISSTDNVVEIRIDAPDGIMSDALHQLHNSARNVVNQFVGSEILGNAFDLFDLIGSIYEDKNEGKVVELGFTTSTGSVKLEKMRRTRICLRDETYHVGGKKSLQTKIEPFPGISYMGIR